MPYACFSFRTRIEGGGGIYMAQPAAKCRCFHRLTFRADSHLGHAGPVSEFRNADILPSLSSFYRSYVVHYFSLLIWHMLLQQDAFWAMQLQVYLFKPRDFSSTLGRTNFIALLCYSNCDCRWRSIVRFRLRFLSPSSTTYSVHRVRTSPETYFHEHAARGWIWKCQGNCIQL